MKIEGNKGYRCKNIQIAYESKFANFNCLERLEPCKTNINNFCCIAELLPEGNTAYEVTLKSNNSMQQNLNSPVLVALVGEKGISNYQMLTESGLQIGSSVVNTIKINDIGKVSGFKIKITEKGKFGGSYLIIKSFRTGLVYQFDLKDVSLENPGNDSFSLDTAVRNNNEDKNSYKEYLKKPNSESGFNKLFEEAGNLFEKEANKEKSEEEGEDDGLITFTPGNSEALQQQPPGLDNGNAEFNINNPD